ncbi:MAG: RNA polymerase sigma factor [Gammaproteobacteria bacterium]
MSDTVHVDKAVAKRILAGDHQVFKDVFDRFFPRLYRYAVVRLDGDREAARDVVQQTFCKAIERLDSYRGEAALYAWFTRICRNSLIDYCRSRNREMQRVVPLEDRAEIQAVLDAIAGPEADQPETQARRRDTSRLVKATLDRLPARYGDILEWKYAHGLSVKEIAERLSLKPKAVESLLTRARVAFRHAIVALGSTADIQDASNGPIGR